MTKTLRSHCPINFGLEHFGDKWSLLILRDILFRGKKTYGEFLRSEEGFATNILASRLKSLDEDGILTKSKNPEDARKDIYSLSEKGIDLVPMLFEMMLWSSKYDPESEAKRIKKLIAMIEKDNRKISEKIKNKLRKGEAIFPEYLD
ncbi:helix-turn-helix domain-containing protein [Leptospira sp. 96542]|nr:helix-turn-helix domain-containing protein [Leptospira sp. 96542]